LSLKLARTGMTRALLPCLSAVALAVCATAVLATPASATCASPCHWYSGALSLNFGYASIEAHSLTYVQGNANHNEFCIGAEQGSAGSYSDPSASDCQAWSNGTFAASRFYSGACCFHATIVNVGPLSSITVSSSTHYDY
jgi:hypothetical protein